MCLLSCTYAHAADYGRNMDGTCSRAANDRAFVSTEWILICDELQVQALCKQEKFQFS
jgi:hypothetical protein